MKSNEQSYRRRVEQPVERPGHLHDDKRYSHPAYGQISAHRVTGGAVLYGSDFRHDGYVEITIKRSEMNRTLARDWPSAREELITVALSEAQWARFVSAMNVGEGPCCTLDRVMGEPMPALPDPTDRRAQFAGESDDTARRVLTELKALREDIAASGLPAKRAKPMLDRIHQAEMAAGVNQEWVAKQFDKHMETTVQHAAIEINAMVTNAVHQVGLDSIRERGISAPTLPAIERRLPPEGAHYDLDELDVTIRTHNVLHRAGILTIEEATTFSADGLLALPDLGPASLEEVRLALRSRGLALHGEKA